MNKSKTNWLIVSIILLLVSGCSQNESETEGAKTVRLLTNNSSKSWKVAQTFIDDIEQSISACDSSYILTLHADFMWDEVFLKLACYQVHDGTWELNEDNSLITIQFIDQPNGGNVKKIFEILELTETYFSYQFAENNQLKKIRLTVQK